MGKYREFAIHFDRDNETYFAGEQLCGNVVLHLHEHTNILRIALLVKGKGICRIGNTCKELIYQNEVTLFGAKPGTRSINHEHPSGRQQYRFNFMLPSELPSSTVEGGGSIKYALYAKVMFKGILTSDWQIKKPFEVKEILDANIPNYDLQHVHTAKKIPTIFQNTKKLEKEDILVSLERGIYCPGEEVKVHLQYKYVEARKLGIVKCRLNKYGQFNKKENKNVHKKTIIEQNDQRRSDDKIYQRIISIQIPDKVTPTNTLTNSVVINYVIHVKDIGKSNYH